MKNRIRKDAKRLGKLTKPIKDPDQVGVEMWRYQKEKLGRIWSKAEGQIKKMSSDFPFLLFAWDEARHLVRSENQANFQSSFERIIQMIDIITSKTGCNLFHIFTETPSHLDEFTLRRAKGFEQLLGTFQPFILFANFDYYAKYFLVTTLDPEKMMASERILHFGRVAWISYYHNGATEQDLIDLAAFKLT